jgi:hypothetical protein
MLDRKFIMLFHEGVVFPRRIADSVAPSWSTGEFTNQLTAMFGWMVE